MPVVRGLKNQAAFDVDRGEPVRAGVAGVQRLSPVVDVGGVARSVGVERGAGVGAVDQGAVREDDVRPRCEIVVGEVAEVEELDGVGVLLPGRDA